MSWATDFKLRLRARVLEPVVIVDVGQVSGIDLGFPAAGIHASRSFTSDMRFTTRGTGEDGAASPQYLLTDVRMSRASVRLRTWESTPGGFRFSVMSKSPRGTLRWPFRPAKGLPVRVRFGFGDYTIDQFETVAFGIVTQMSKVGDSWDVECASLLEAFRTRPARFGTVDHVPNFENAGKQSALSIGFTGNSGTDLAVDDNSIFDLEVGGVGCARIESPTSGVDSGDPPWYFVFDGTYNSGGQDYLNALGSPDWFGQTAATTFPVGTLATSCVAFGGSTSTEPWDIFLAIAFSTLLPTSWGLTLTGGVVDADDVRSMETHPASGGVGTRWCPMADAPEDDLWKWVRDGLSEFNLFPIMREGKISLNIAASLTDILTGDTVRETITDDHIVSIDSHQMFHPDARPEYRQVRDGIQTGTNYSGTFGIESIPWVRYFDKSIAVSADGFDKIALTPRMGIQRGQTGPNATTITHVGNAQIWYTHIPESLSLTLAGLRFAHLALGDVVEVQSEYLYGRYESYSPDSGGGGQRGMIIDHETDWLQGQVRLTIAIIPTPSTEQD